MANVVLYDVGLLTREEADSDDYISHVSSFCLQDALLFSRIDSDEELRSILTESYVMPCCGKEKTLAAFVAAGSVCCPRRRKGSKLKNNANGSSNHMNNNAMGDGNNTGQYLNAKIHGSTTKPGRATYHSTGGSVGHNSVGTGNNNNSNSINNPLGSARSSVYSGSVNLDNMSDTAMSVATGCSSHLRDDSEGEFRGKAAVYDNDDDGRFGGTAGVVHGVDGIDVEENNRIHGDDDDDDGIGNISSNDEEDDEEENGQDDDDDDDDDDAAGFFYSFCRGAFVSRSDLTHCFRCHCCVEWNYWHCLHCDKCSYYPYDGTEPVCVHCGKPGRFIDDYSANRAVRRTAGDDDEIILRGDDDDDGGSDTERFGDPLVKADHQSARSSSIDDIYGAYGSYATIEEDGDNDWYDQGQSDGMIMENIDEMDEYGGGNDSDEHGYTTETALLRRQQAKGYTNGNLGAGGNAVGGEDSIDGPGGAVAADDDEYDDDEYEDGDNVLEWRPFPPLHVPFFHFVGFAYLAIMIGWHATFPLFGRFGWIVQFFTIDVLFLSAIYYLTVMAVDLFPNARRLRKFSDAIHTVCFAGTMLTAVAFWGLYFYGHSTTGKSMHRMLLPRGVAIPALVLVLSHGSPWAFMVIDTLITEHRSRRSEGTFVRDLLVTLATVGVYVVWAFVCKSRNGDWSYPQFDEVTDSIGIGVILSCLSFAMLLVLAPVRWFIRRFGKRSLAVTTKVM